MNGSSFYHIIGIMNERVKELISNSALFTIANMGSKILVFLMVPLYTAVLSTEEYGISDLVQTTAMLLYPILTCMISEAVLRFCFLKGVNPSQAFYVGIQVVAIGSIINVFLGVGFLYVPFFSSLGLYVLFIPIMFIGHSLSQLFHKLTRGIGKVKISATAGLMSTGLVVSLNLLFLLVFKIGILGYLLSYALAEYASAGYMALSCNSLIKKFPRIESGLCSQMLKYSIPLVPNSLSWWALSSVNRYIMLSYIGVSAVGIYSASMRIPSILTVLCDIFAQAWLLSALKNYESEETKAFINAIHNRYSSVVIILTATFIILSKPITMLLLSGDFSDYWYVTPFLFISVFWGAMVGFLGAVFSAERKNTMQFVSTVIGAMFSIVITFLFLKQFGVIVVAIATMMGFFVIWLVRRLAVNKYICLSLSTLNSILQGLILIVESYLVCISQYYLATVCIAFIILLNYKHVWPVVIFAWRESNILIHNRLTHYDKTNHS